MRYFFPKYFFFQAVRDHMLKKGHCYVNVQGENALEYAQFYDFSKSNKEPELLREEILQEHLRENEPEESFKKVETCLRCVC